MITLKEKIIGGIVFTLVLLITLYFWINPKDYVTKIISNMVKEQQEQIMKEYEEKVKQYDKDLKDLKSKVQQSDEKINKLNKKIKGLEVEVDENKKPETIDDMRDRFRKLGYPPIN